MAPNPRVSNAFRAMREMGFKEDKVKPVLKKLLKLYDKNWEFIEEENYRVLALAIIEEEDDNSQVAEKRSGGCDGRYPEEENIEPQDQVRPLKRLRRGPAVPTSAPPSNSNLGVASLIIPKREEEELPVTSLQQPMNMAKSPDARAEPLSCSPQPNVRNKGKQPVYDSPVPQERSNSLSTPVPALRKRPSSGGPSHAARLKAPMAEPGNTIVPRQNAPDSYALIRPKDEPFTDDMYSGDRPQYEVPLAVIRPDPSSNGHLPANNNETGKQVDPSRKRHFPVENDKTGTHVGEESPSQCINCEGRDSDTPGRLKTNGELAPMQESSSNLEVARSPLGEVKLSLSLNSATGRPDFRMPDLEAVMKLTEEKCLRSYKIIDPNFSVTKLLTHICESFLELGTDSVNEPHNRSIDVSSTLDALKKSTVSDALGCNKEHFYMVSSTSNGSHNAESHSMMDAPSTTRLPIFSNGPESHIHATRETMNKSHYENVNKEGERDVPESTNTSAMVILPQRDLTFDELRWLHDKNDITKGEERVRISWTDESNGNSCPSFQYISQSLVFKNADVNFLLSRIQKDDCCATCFGDCLLASNPCVCARETNGVFAYTSGGLVKDVFLEECVSMAREPHQTSLIYCQECPIERLKSDDCLEPCKGHLKRKFIKECWSKCGCNKQCGNRVVQQGITYNLQVFYTAEGKGWGLRTLEDLPKGAFVCEYVGEILTSTEMYERNMENTRSGKCTYLVLLDAVWGCRGALKNEEALCLDSSKYGNVARFINHRCFDANLVEIPVEIETPDRLYYHLAFFTARKVDAMEELTWDYGIDFDDLDNPIKPFKCHCGSKFCRNMKRSNRSRANLMARGTN